MSARGRYRPRFRTDWFRVLADLQRCGYDNARVAKIMGAPEATLRYWKQGSEPAHNYGHSLLEVWQDVTGKTLGERPMMVD